jgi:intracellular septation protein
MSHRKLSTGMKTALDLGPIAAFFVAYFLIKDRDFTIAGRVYTGFVVATAAFIPILMFTTFLFWRLTGKVSKMQIVTLVVVVVFGGLTVWFNDERFFKMKPTLIYLIFGSILAFGLWRGESYLQLVMEEMMPLRREGWMKLTRRFAAFFFGLAIANEVIWRNLSTETWVTFKTIGLPVVIFLFFFSQARLFQTYAVDETKPEE